MMLEDCIEGYNEIVDSSPDYAEVPVAAVENLCIIRAAALHHVQVDNLLKGDCKSTGLLG